MTRVRNVLQAIVAQLSSIEQLAGMNMLCSDKTGTLTQNKMVLYGFSSYMDGSTQDTVSTRRVCTRKVLTSLALGVDVCSPRHQMA